MSPRMLPVITVFLLIACLSFSLSSTLPADISPNITSITALSPACGPVNSYTIVSIIGEAFSHDSTVSFGGAPLPSSHVLSMSTQEILFITPSSLDASMSYPIVLCGNYWTNVTTTTLTNVTIVVNGTDTNCTTDVIPVTHCNTYNINGTDFNCTIISVNTDSTNCTNNNNGTYTICNTTYVPVSTCTNTSITYNETILVNVTTWVLLKNRTCIATPTPFTPYEVPPILMDFTINPTNVTLTGHNFLQQCGNATKARISSSSSIEDIPAHVISPSEVVFFLRAGRGVTGVISLGLDGQHFDSLSTKLMYINTGGVPPSNTGGSGGGNGGDNNSKPNRTWLWILLSVIGTGAFAFLIYVIWKIKTKDNDGYSQLSSF
jgi:hypothetical protein